MSFRKRGTIIFQAEKKSDLNKQLGHNNNFWDLGFSNEMTDEANINSAVAEILHKFDLIMISDYMDQSLILLKNELGWNIEDILYFTINKRFDFFSFSALFLLGRPLRIIFIPRILTLGTMCITEMIFSGRMTQNQFYQMN